MTYYGDLIVPAGAEVSPLKEGKGWNNAPSDEYPRCPLCRSGQDAQSLAASRQILEVLLQLQAEQADLRSVADCLKELIASRASEQEVDEELANLKAGGLRRLLPHGQANVLAFASLVVSVATLAESILVSLPLISPESRPPEPDHESAVAISQVDIGLRSTAPVALQGTFRAVHDVRPWALRFDRHSRGGSSRARRRHGPTFDFEAHQCRTEGGTWTCEVEPPRSFRAVEWHVAVALLPASFTASPPEIRDPETSHEAWLGHTVTQAAALVSFERYWYGEGEVSSWKAAAPRTESLEPQKIGDFLFQLLCQQLTN